MDRGLHAGVAGRHIHLQPATQKGFMGDGMLAGPAPHNQDFIHATKIPQAYQPLAEKTCMGKRSTPLPAGGEKK